MSARIQEFLDRVTVVDGAWGTELDKLGCPAGYCREEWNISHPELVQKVAGLYVEAGARIVLTNTFGANRYALGRHDQSAKATEYNRAGAAISKQAAGDKARVFGSIGPSGKIVMMGEVAQGELYQAFKEQAEALAEGGADGLVVETMSELIEVVTAVKAAKTTGLLVVGCMTFDSGKDRTCTMMGVTPEKAAQAIVDAGADMVGCNCGIGIDNYIRVAARFRAVTTKPIWVKANAGMPEIDSGKVVYKMTPDEFAEKAKALVKAGANLVGGCCGTHPAFTRALATALA
jgi:5-methyltetrahydrofolate--homocysteine methyltransferase